MVPVVQRMNNGFRLINNYPMDRVVYFVKSGQKSYPSPHVLVFDGKAMRNNIKDVKQLH